MNVSAQSSMLGGHRERNSRPTEETAPPDDVGVDLLATIDAGDLLLCMCESLREHAARKDIRLVVFATCGGVHVHVRSFAAAILAVVNNAVDAAMPGTRVIITARPTDEADALASQSLGVVLAQLAVEQDGGFVPARA